MIPVVSRQFSLLKVHTHLTTRTPVVHTTCLDSVLNTSSSSTSARPFLSRLIFLHRLHHVDARLRVIPLDPLDQVDILIIPLLPSILVNVQVCVHHICHLFQLSQLSLHTVRDARVDVALGSLVSSLLRLVLRDRALHNFVLYHRPTITCHGLSNHLPTRLQRRGVHVPCDDLSVRFRIFIPQFFCCASVELGVYVEPRALPHRPVQHLLLDLHLLDKLVHVSN